MCSIESALVFRNENILTGQTQSWFIVRCCCTEWQLPPRTTTVRGLLPLLVSLRVPVYRVAAALGSLCYFLYIPVRSSNLARSSLTKRVLCSFQPCLIDRQTDRKIDRRNENGQTKINLIG
jgi:hypothetical protein